MTHDVVVSDCSVSNSHPTLNLSSNFDIMVNSVGVF